jgi:hypothetical protein
MVSFLRISPPQHHHPSLLSARWRWFCHHALYIPVDVFATDSHIGFVQISLHETLHVWKMRRVRDFKLLPWSGWELRASGLLCSE